MAIQHIPLVAKGHELIQQLLHSTIESRHSVMYMYSMHSLAQVVDMTKGIVDIPEWFHGCELNFAENLLKHPDQDKVALITYGEGQLPGYITFGQLRQRVASIAAALRANGVARGDRVVGYLPNSSLAVEAMLATASIGAIWSSTSPDFGVTVGCWLLM